MSGSFVTNRSGKSLSEIIKSILPKAEHASFLVGYFYFSGFGEIYEGLKDKALRVLVGLEIEQDMINRVREVDYHVKELRTRGEIKATFYDSLKDLFNETDYFDNSEKQAAFTLFLTKIKDGSLEIRKTKEPNHAKMYVFQNKREFDDAGTYPGALITGSSNLSLDGLKGRLELNAILRDKADFEEGKKIFDELWETAIVLADKNNLAEFENAVIEKIWYEKLYKPYCFFLRVLDEYFSVNYDKDFKTAYEITNGNFYDLKYQTDAVKLALATIETHSGVIISDVVGLGKSIIASAVAHNLGLRAIIVAPPHLVPQWEDYAIEFNYNAKVFSSGKIGAALDYYKQKAAPNRNVLVIIDEAHKYRNEFTTDYNNLHNLCRGNKVMLLTATPFNNRPADIYSMVKLFQLPAKSTLKTVDNLGVHFNELIKQYSELQKKQRKHEIDEILLKQEADYIADQIRRIISPLVIRRSRLDILGISDYREDLEKQNMGFAEIGDPESLEYNLGNIQDLYIDTLEQIAPDFESEEEPIKKHYLAARYNAINYVKDRGALKRKIEDAGFDYNLFIGMQGNLSKFIRRLLVQRFESSKKAFEISLERMIKTSRNILNWIDRRKKAPIFKKGYLPDIAEHYREYESFGDDALDNEIVEAAFEMEIEKLESKGLFELDIQYLENSFIEDINSDIQILEQIQKNWFGESLPDPKKEHFVEIISGQIKKDPKRKIIVFSSYADTINDLYDKLIERGIRAFKYTSKDANKTNKETIELNFDAGKNIQNNDYDVLVATDAISEGYNLHRAGTVFNYDIPYNPTRVIQRVGRINRINKKMFDRLYIYNYFPTNIGEGETRTKEITTLKMAMINAIIGEDTKVLTSDIELRSYFVDQYRKMLKTNEVESWETKYRELFSSSKGTSEYETAKNIPHRSRIGRTAKKKRKGVLLFGRKKDVCIFKISDNLGTEILAPDEAFDLLEADILEQPHNVSAGFNALYQNLKQTLFQNTMVNKIEKPRRDTLDKIVIIAQTQILSEEYINNLKNAAEIGALSGLSMQYIRQLKPKDFSTLPRRIEADFLERVIKMSREVDDGTESIILSEELR